MKVATTGLETKSTYMQFIRNTQVNRKKSAIIWNEVMESGGVAVADEISIGLDLELIKNTKR